MRCTPDRRRRIRRLASPTALAGALPVAAAALALALLVPASGARADVEVAAPEPCATALDVALQPEAAALADRTLAAGLPPVSAAPPLAATLAGAAGSPLLQLQPTDVAAGPGGPGAPAAPPAPDFRGVGSCDDPGSGCMGPIQPTSTPAPAPAPRPPSVVNVPPPVAPCGAPGFPCP